MNDRADSAFVHSNRLVVFGLPKFSGNALFQADPPQWCDASFKYVLLAGWLDAVFFAFAHGAKRSGLD